MQLHTNTLNNHHYQSSTSKKTISPADLQKNKAEKFSIHEENISQSKEKPASPLVTNDVQNTLLALQEKQNAGQPSQSVILSTSKGAQEINLDEYFSPNSQKERINLDDIPLLLPNAENLKALTAHAEERFNKLLEKYNIPHAPEEITYNSEGKIILPADYPYSKELKQALNENEGIDRELRTLHALTSHYTELQKSFAFHEEFIKTETRAEADAIVAKYSHLFDDNRRYSKTALSFSEDGIKLLSDGNELRLD
jgi:hypothetical protein